MQYNKGIHEDSESWKTHQYISTVYMDHEGLGLLATKYMYHPKASLIFTL